MVTIFQQGEGPGKGTVKSRQVALTPLTVNIKFRGSHKIGARNSEHQVAAAATVAAASGYEGFHGQ